MRKFRLLLLTSCFSLIGFGQADRGTVTIGAGGGFPAGGYQTEGFSNSAAFSGSYEFRLFHYLAPEIGVQNLIPNVLEDDKYGPLLGRERVSILSFGLRGIAPLRHGRIELFAGGGGAYLWSSDSDFNGDRSSNWLFQVVGGGRAAIDHRHRFWIGPTVRFSRDAGRPTQEWVSLTADFGFRF